MRGSRQNMTEIEAARVIIWLPAEAADAGQAITAKIGPGASC